MKPLLLIVALLLAGCTGQMVLLKNDAGQVARCEYSGYDYFWRGGWAMNDLEKCTQQYEQAGFKRIETAATDRNAHNDPRN